MAKVCSLPSNLKLELKGDILVVSIHKCHKNILLTFAVNLIMDRHRGENKTSIKNKKTHQKTPKITLREVTIECSWLFPTWRIIH